MPCGIVEEEASSESSGGKYIWLLGAFLSILGTVCSNIGVNVQKYSQNKNLEQDPESRQPYYKQPWWAVGLGLVIAGSLGDFTALGFAAQSIVAPIGAIALVANIFFSHWCLKETLNKIDVIGTIAVITGATLAVAFGNHEDQVYTLDQLKDLFLELGFFVYAAIVLAAMVVLYTFIRFVEPQKLKLLATFEMLEEAAKTRQRTEARDLQKQIRHLEKQYKKFEKLHPFFYCALSGLCGAQSLLFAKAVSVLARMAFSGSGGDGCPNPFTQFFSYLFLALMFVFIFAQLHFLAIALKFFDALYVVPVFQCFFILCSTIGGAVYFKEFALFNSLQAIFFPIGVFITLLGVYILSKREMTKSLSQRNAEENLAHMGLRRMSAMSMGSVASTLGFRKSSPRSRTASRGNSIAGLNGHDESNKSKLISDTDEAHRISDIDNRHTIHVTDDHETQSNGSRESSRHSKSSHNNSRSSRQSHQSHKSHQSHQSHQSNSISSPNRTALGSRSHSEPAIQPHEPEDGLQDIVNGDAVDNSDSNFDADENSDVVGELHINTLNDSLPLDDDILEIRERMMQKGEPHSPVNRPPTAILEEMSGGIFSSSIIATKVISGRMAIRDQTRPIQLQ